MFNYIFKNKSKNCFIYVLFSFFSLTKQFYYYNTFIICSCIALFESVILSNIYEIDLYSLLHLNVKSQYNIVAKFQLFY